MGLRLDFKWDYNQERFETRGQAFRYWWSDRRVNRPWKLCVGLTLLVLVCIGVLLFAFSAGGKGFNGDNKLKLKLRV